MQKYEGKTETQNIGGGEGERTNPPGNDPGSVEWYIISSNWNVFKPGAAHTSQSKVNRQKSLT